MGDEGEAGNRGPGREDLAEVLERRALTEDAARRDAVETRHQRNAATIVLVLLVVQPDRGRSGR